MQHLVGVDKRFRGTKKPSFLLFELLHFGCHSTQLRCRSRIEFIQPSLQLFLDLQARCSTPFRAFKVLDRPTQRLLLRCHLPCELSGFFQSLLSSLQGCHALVERGLHELELGCEGFFFFGKKARPDLLFHETLVTRLHDFEISFLRMGVA